ncbi:DUF3027 domain-containing protein [Mycolicibacterium sp. P9-64]|uniref:DUF3027 domain-containing protein n=1 Tax=Mycolicibacterium sp. P9-64 TaxID=2024612 RepID=UPI001F5BF483|nr:DUF3027 domain-containing protein [Mycolicibacterium sp. P9-64]
MIEAAEHDAAVPPTENRADLAAVLTGAVDLARTAIVEINGSDAVGDYLGASFDDPTAATHRFLASMPGYQGWQWAVVVAAYPGADHATISEVVLVPGPTALLAPQWVPWENRLQPGDLSPGDLLSPPTNDPRLVPGYVSSGDPELDHIAGELGLGRRQVLSAWGRIEAAQRWQEGDFGPDSTMARSTRRVCRDCGFYLPLTGSLGTAFGVCANEMSADGRVVADEYGCGAHSETPAPPGIGSPAFDPFDDGVIEVTEVVPVAPVEDVVEAAEPMAEEAAEPAEAEELEQPTEVAEATDPEEPTEPAN